MPAANRPDLNRLLAAGASTMGIPLVPSQIGQFLRYLAILKEWNRRMNLTTITSDEEIIEKHFLDSLAGLKAIDRPEGKTVLDLGTGAGFPGLPLKIAAPGLRLTLVEPSQKKVAFLHHLCGLLGLTGVTLLNERVEALLKTRIRYDVIVSRALARPQAVLRKASGLLRPSGRLVLYLGRAPRGKDALESADWEETLPYSLPFSKIHRRLEVFRPAPNKA